MKAPFILHQPQTHDTPVLFDSPHSGTHYPESFNYQPSHFHMRMLEDMYVNDLYADVPALGAPFLEATFPRSFIDTNRKLEDLDPTMVEGGWTYHSPRDSHYVRSGKGLIWKEAYIHGAIYKKRLSVEEVKNRIENYYKPYHEVLRNSLDDMRLKFGVAYHVNCHSMPGISFGGELDDKGTKRPDVVVSDRSGNSCDGAFTAFVKGAFESHGLYVTENHPYRGGEIVEHYGNPTGGIHSLQIELNRDMYLNTTDLTKSPEFDTLHVIVSDVCRQICDYAKSQIPQSSLPKGLKDRRKTAI